MECKISLGRIWGRPQEVSPFQALEISAATQDHGYSEIEMSGLCLVNICSSNK